MIKSTDPIDFQRRGRTRREDLQIGQRLTALRVEQAVNDQIVCVANLQRFPRSDPEFVPLVQVLAGLNHLCRETLTRVSILKITVLSHLRETNGVGRLETELRASSQMSAFLKISRNGKLRRRESGAPIPRFHWVATDVG